MKLADEIAQPLLEALFRAYRKTAPLGIELVALAARRFSRARNVVALFLEPRAFVAKLAASQRELGQGCFIIALAPLEQRFGALDDLRIDSHSQRERKCQRLSGRPDVELERRREAARIEPHARIGDAGR